MSGSGFDRPGEAQAGEEVPFVERDDRSTTLNYDRGGVPLYVSVVWILFIAAYVLVMSLLALPDLRAWMAH